MYTYFIFILDLETWRQHRVISACQAFLTVLDPGFKTEPRDLEGVRVGWFFYLTSDEDRRRLIVFFSGLVGKVAEEQADRDPAIQGAYDAAAALGRLAGVAR